MVNNRRYVITILMILFAGLAFASFEIGDLSYSIDNTYGASDNVRGWINLSLNNEPTTSVFQDSNGNTIELIDLLEKNTDYSYSCTPIGCFTDYNANNGETSKTFTLDAGDSALFGLKFTGDLVAINSIDFSVESDSSVSCASQIKIDILNDEDVDFINNKTAVGSSCSELKSYGCYNAALNKEEYIITDVPYCQKINLSESPGFSIGAWVRKVSGSKNLSMSLYDYIGSEVANCQLPAITSQGDISCDVNYSVTEVGEHYVCIYSTSGTGDYRIRGNKNPSEGCGFHGFPLSATIPAAYQIFVQGKGFDAVGTLQISDSLSSGETLGDLAHDYILETYGDFDCSTGCVVPINFVSGINNHQLTIKDLSVNYEKVSGLLIEDDFYDLTELPARVGSDFQKLYLDEGGFSVPDELGSYYFSLSLEGDEIILEQLNIEDIAKIYSITPSSTASAYPTEFEVEVNSSTDITNYLWNFGDGETEVTTTNKAIHTYSAIGEYDLAITVTDSRGFTSSKTFSIVVSSPRNLIATTITKLKNNTDNLETQFADFDVFTKESLSSILQISSATQELERLETAFNAAETETEYNLIITALLELNIPESVVESVSAEKIPFFPDREDIDLSILQTIGGGSYDLDKEEAYTNAIIMWNQENIESEIDFTEFSGIYKDSEEPILRIFEIDIKEKQNIEDNYFFIIPEIDDLSFEQSVLQREESGYVYVDLRGEEIISFSTTEDVDFLDLPAFISPAISKLSVTEEPVSIQEEKKQSKRAMIIIAIFFLLILGVGGYMVLQEWYKKKYETYLFRNRNDLFNMATYIHDTKKKGLTHRQISHNLRRSGWNDEQVKYAMKKYTGKRTGMAELPITKMLDKVKKGKNIRQPRGGIPK